jgi:hypothetical protein
VHDFSYTPRVPTTRTTTPTTSAVAKEDRQLLRRTAPHCNENAQKQKNTKPAQQQQKTTFPNHRRNSGGWDAGPVPTIAVPAMTQPLVTPPLYSWMDYLASTANQLSIC